MVWCGCRVCIHQAAEDAPSEHCGVFSEQPSERRLKVVEQVAERPVAAGLWQVVVATTGRFTA